jgi:hypothetical protein
MMKSRNLLLSVISFVVFSIVFVGQALAVDVCLNEPSSCNDIKLIVPTTVVEGGVYSVVGYEYGCGYYNKEIYGTLRVKSGLWYINTTKNAVYDGQAMTSPEVVVYNPTKGTGTYKGIIIYSDDSWDVSGTYKKVSCTSVVAQPTSELASELDNDRRK